MPSTTKPHASDADDQEGSADKPLFSRIRVTPATAEVFRTFQDKHDAGTDQAIRGLIEFYESHTQYRFSAETGHLLADIRKLDATIVTLVTLNFQLMELQRSLQQADAQASAAVIEAEAARMRA